MVLMPTPSNAEFQGTLAFQPQGCESKALCEIVSDFKYIDPNQIAWLTKKGDMTDGASIPPWAQPFIGEPFDKSFIKAAVIHDHYCDRHVRPWQQTHRVFYDALIESGVDTAKAKLMYYAVYFAGPKLVELVPGKDCGPRCQYMQPFALNFDASGGSGPASSDKEATEQTPSELIVRTAQYDKPGFLPEMREVEKLLKEKGDSVTLVDLENRAKAKMPDDFFYRTGATISKDALSQDKTK